MEANGTSLLELIKNADQFVIPIYQRSYDWTGKQHCQQLWNDVVRAGSSPDIGLHFIGSIVYIKDSLYQVSRFKPVLVIDGQQRLTTMMLLLFALAEKLGDREVNDFTAVNIKKDYLMDSSMSDERRYKLLLKETDKDSLIAILDGRPKPQKCSNRIYENFEFFDKLLEQQKDKLDVICQGLLKLQVVDIALERNRDNPQLIFESVNSTGLALSQADLIRNFVLMGVAHKKQTHLYNDYWRQMEIKFGQKAYRDNFDKFMRDYLTVKNNGAIPKISMVYATFKKFFGSLAGDVEQPLADLRDFAEYYCNLALGAEPDKELREAFQDLRDLKVDVAYPFLLQIYSDYAKGILSKEDLLQVVRTVESYVFRRAICLIPTNSLNNTFATFSKALKDDRSLKNIQLHLLTLPSYRRYPQDEEFKSALQSRNLYKLNSGRYWLYRLENFNRKERIVVDPRHSIEHILPQNPDLSAEWRAALGDRWQEIQEQYLHTLGNLTLTGYNSEYQDKPFADKRDMENGFAQSPFKLNAGLGQVQVWNETAIQDRAQRLADEAVKVWAYPNLPEAILKERRAKETTDELSLESHQSLNQEFTRDLFDAFSKEVRALDDCIVVEVKKLYIAFKAETNIVDVVPQKGGLKLMLNIAFARIADPRGICRDITNIGHWGNGDVECVLEKHDDLPYVIGLVRQAFDAQLGDENIELCDDDAE